MTPEQQDLSTEDTDGHGQNLPLGASFPGRLAHRWAAGVLIAATALLLTLTGGQSVAQASQGNTSFDAYCNSNHAITAWAPDLTHDGAEWTVIWAPTLYRYNGSSWVKYLDGATQVEGQGGTGHNWWIVQNVWFSHLPQGYYQVRTTYAWLHNGVKTGAHGIFEPVTHKLDGVSNYSGASWATLRYSNSRYCYES